MVDSPTISSDTIFAWIILPDRVVHLPNVTLKRTGSDRYATIYEYLAGIITQV